MDTRQIRSDYLRQWGQALYSAAGRGAFGDAFQLRDLRAVCGPRAGALLLDAGMYAGRTLQALRKHDSALLRQFVPWSFAGDPSVFMQSRHVRVEAAWPSELAMTSVALGDLAPYPLRPDVFVVGMNEYGQTIAMQLCDAIPHVLISGTPGSGKTIAMRSIAYQLARHATEKERARLVLIDGKYGDSLRSCQRLAGVVGPVATSREQVISALAFAAKTMRERYEHHEKPALACDPLVVLFDEFQELTNDRTIAGLMAKIAREGRAARVHLVCATQHPALDAFGDASTRRCLVGKLALRVDDLDASRVAVGSSTPRADRLLGAGDAYTVSPGAVHRVQVAILDEAKLMAQVAQRDIERWLFDAWPEVQLEDVGQDVPQRPSRRQPATVDELQATMRAAIAGDGRPAMVQRLDSERKPGASRARWLLALGRDVWSQLEGSAELSVWLETHRAGQTGRAGDEDARAFGRQTDSQERNEA